jgi:hypothetical protein
MAAQGVGSRRASARELWLGLPAAHLTAVLPNLNGLGTSNLGFLAGA